ncbi:CHASE domain-containing protein [Teredinibacter purpureus]|uniref:CHASE domain-containing protein n=1 Tax=Teredinibacter purpureus TaxID=2731756 RepID=UPI0006969A0C|nr:CHASE domain-containing protein [Teredinibacter purpureus]
MTHKKNSTKFNSRVAQSANLHWYHWLVVAGSILLTLSAWYITAEQAEAKMTSQFDFQSAQIVQLVQERMEKYEQVLWASAAALNAMPENVNRHEWRTYSTNLKLEKRLPGINGIGIIHRVTADKFPTYLAWQRELQPDYYVHPPHDNTEFWPISYIEPQDLNAKAVGLDMAHESNRFTAAKKSRDTGTAQITGPIVLVQDEQNTPGFLFYAPWVSNKNELIAQSTQERFNGLVYSPFIMHKLMDGTLANTNRQVNFSVHDGNSELYNELTKNSEDYDPKPLMKTDVALELYGRRWDFHIQSSLIFRSHYSQHQPLMILIGGIAIDALLLFLFIVLSRTNKQAVVYADKVTKDLQIRRNELEKTLGRLSGAMNAMMDALIVIDEFGKIVEANRTVERIFGYERDYLLGKNISLLIPYPDNERHDSYLARKTPPEFNPMLGQERKLHALHQQGHVFPIKLNVTKGEHQDHLYYTGVIHDLSDFHKTNKALEKSENVLKAAMKNSNSGFIVTDSEGNIVDVNTSICNWLGYSPEDLIGQPENALIANIDKQDAQRTIKSLANGEKVSVAVELQYQHKEGHSLWGLVTVTAVSEETGKAPFIVSQIASLETQKKLENDLEKQNAYLEEANRELNQFAYIASHDLKEPLRTLRTFTSYLLKDLETQKWDRVAQDVYHVDSSAERMTRLINALLELSRASNADLKLQPIESSTLISDIRQNLQAQIQDSDADIIVNDVGLTFNADGELLSQVIQNLVSNAIKFHKPDNIPKVTISTRKQNSNTGEITVKDEGVGIAHNQLDNIFFPFKRLHGIAEYEGTGIGLSIVKKIVDRHKGRITVESEPGLGSCFSIQLPLSLLNNNKSSSNGENNI